MRVVEVDERDSTWEEHRPRYRVYLFTRRAGATPWSVRTFDVTGADVLQVTAWAQEQAHRTSGQDGEPQDEQEQQFAIALIGETGRDPDPGGAHRGLVWLVGMDANDTPEDDHQRQLLARMSARAG